MPEQRLWGAWLTACIVGSLVAWIWAARRRMQSRAPLLDWRPRPLAPWGLLQLIATALALFLGASLLVVVARQLGWTGRGRGLDETAVALLLMAAAEVGLLAGIVLAVAGLRWVNGASWRDLGLDGLPRASDLMQGGVTFLLLFAPVYGLKGLIQQVMGPEGEHPLIELIRRNPRAEFLGPMFLLVVISAPIVEELLFRVIIQNWFRAVAWGARHRSWWVPRSDRTWVHLVSGRSVRQELAAEEAEGGPPVAGGPVDRPVAALPDTAERVAGDEPTEHGSEGDAAEPLAAGPPAPAPRSTAAAAAAEEGPSWWPIVGSSILFALAHWGYNLDPIPLFVLAMGLGYLYQRTGRVYPCMVVHGLINSMAVVQMWLMIRQGA